MNHLKKLPVDVQAFEIMRGEQYVYVDKTRHIARMLSEGCNYFLSRPRRFGKSLFVSTLKCLFEGKEELFRDLWIAEHGDWAWQPHPVVLIDEYDKPILDHLGKGDAHLDIAKANRDLLKNFFGVLKSDELTPILRVYTLGYPNQEVKRAFLERLLLALTDWEKRKISSHVLKLAGYLEQQHFYAFFETMRAIFASIPYTLNAQQDEAYFHTIF